MCGCIVPGIFLVLIKIEKREMEIKQYTETFPWSRTKKIKLTEHKQKEENYCY